MNCRLWISGLPPTCTVKQLLSQIRGIGPVYAVHIVPPQIDNTTSKTSISTSAASLTFFSEDAANKFLLRHDQQPITVGGYTIYIVRHRIRTKSFPADGQSRVLVISGNPEIVTPEHLTHLFSEEWNIRFDTEYVEFRQGHVTNEIVWAFGSFRAQAQAAYLFLSDLSREGISVHYAPDPCD
ncbi:hypothetical protein F4804DRAFT_328160 [Jackrogersella minutella]|nr:hypothetical protein F4804DRAFT_328160 [Jackrogersella minutella]